MSDHTRCPLCKREGCNCASIQLEAIQSGGSMSARDDLVAAMEALQFLRDADTPLAQEVAADEARGLSALFVNNHGKHLLALLDAEPVAWMDPNGGPIVERISDIQRVHWIPLIARPEASIADKLRAKGFTERDSNAQEETIRGLTK